MILLVDNYDSFTYNLKQYLEVEKEVVVLRNDDPDLLQTAHLAEAICFSPGPGKPSEAGQMKEVIEQFIFKKPMLGICLGHQALAEVFGATISQAKTIRHGKISPIKQNDPELFHGLKAELRVMRYHSLSIKPESLSELFEVTAVALDDQEIMAIKLQGYPVYGIQFHPESIGTLKGKQMLKNFIAVIERSKFNASTYPKSI
ncbi:aminodeoxychorismate/anthranilate synthase component II [Listeria sp. PSOL-1]|uniref:anthranilate synthase component II n=1 Tax=Listeria sp. PSOL-1 TaxID=1844999 RepID=UPI0013D069C0|nr:aminodeoxychorismate/anthranilate synthase component II [Listeria sp. PSOL-1]